MKQRWPPGSAEGGQRFQICCLPRFVGLSLVALSVPRGDGAQPSDRDVACRDAQHSSLADPPIASGVIPQYLDGNWTAVNDDPARPPLPAVVPGDIITDLQRSGRVPDPYFNNTWRDPGFIAMWNSGTWSYHKKFTVTDTTARAHLLVFDGIRMGAMITLNGHALGNATDQFLRYR